MRTLQLSGNGFSRVSYLQRSHLRVLDKDLPIKKLPNSRDQEGMEVIFIMSLECSNLVLKHKEDALHRSRNEPQKISFNDGFAPSKIPLQMPKNGASYI